MDSMNQEEQSSPVAKPQADGTPAYWKRLRELEEKYGSSLQSMLDQTNSALSNLPPVATADAPTGAQERTQDGNELQGRKRKLQSMSEHLTSTLRWLRHTQEKEQPRTMAEVEKLQAHIESSLMPMAKRMKGVDRED